MGVVLQRLVQSTLEAKVVDDLLEDCAEGFVGMRPEVRGLTLAVFLDDRGDGYHFKLGKGHLSASYLYI
jgi:hypothetical protein